MNAKSKALRNTQITAILVDTSSRVRKTN